jgi:hypothetical protein
VVLPEPGHGVAVAAERRQQGERRAVAVDRQRRAARGIHADPDDLRGAEPRRGGARGAQGALHRGRHAAQVVGGVLARRVRVARVEYDSRLARGVGEDVGARLAAVVEVHDQRAHGVRAEVQAQRVPVHAAPHDRV